jgi:hypothetical protein
VPVEQENAVSARQGAWHQSTLQQIQDCPRRWFLTYQCGLPDPSGEAARIGTAVHTGVEFHEKRRQQGIETSLEEMVDHACATIEEEHHAAVRHGLRHWYKTPMKGGGGVSHREWLAQYEVVAIEPYFNLELVEGALPIGGWIDGVYRDPSTGRYLLVDLKTAGSMSRWKDGGEGKRHQATMYAIALQLSAILPEPIDYLPSMTYTVVKPGTGGECAKRVSVQPDLEDVRVLGQKIRDAEATVSADLFPRNPSWNLCSEKWCPHYNGCMVTGEYAGRPVTVRQELGVPHPSLPQTQSSSDSHPTVTVAITNRRNPQ